MVQRFIRKTNKVRYVRNRKSYNNTVKVDLRHTKTENKEEKNKEDMNIDKNTLEQVENIMNMTDKSLPKRKTKVERKDKGLIERTENSTILLTEDNKMLLND
jgi:hypothetical protein